MSDDEVITFKIEAFTRSAKPEIEAKLKVAASEIGEPVEIDLRLGFPGDDVPKRLIFIPPPSVTGTEKEEIRPEGNETIYRRNFFPLVKGPGEHRVRIEVKHGVYYNTIVSTDGEFSFASPSVVIEGVAAHGPPALPGSALPLSVRLSAPEDGCELELKGKVLSGEEQIGFLERRKVFAEDVHVEEYDVTIPEGTVPGPLDAEISVAFFGESKSERFDNVAEVRLKRELRISDPEVEPGCILPGQPVGIRAELYNAGLDTLTIRPVISVKKNGKGPEVRLEETVLEPPEEAGGAGDGTLSLQSEIENTSELEPGEYILEVRAEGEARIGAAATLLVASGEEIELAGATADALEYHRGDTLHLTALYEAGPMVEGDGLEAEAELTFGGKRRWKKKIPLEIGSRAGVGGTVREGSGGAIGRGVGEGVVEWTTGIDGNVPIGTVGARIRIRKGDRTLSDLDLPYLARVKGSHRLSVVMEKGGLTERAADGNIGFYLFPGEEIAERVVKGGIETVILDNGTRIHLRKDRVMGAEDGDKLFREILARHIETKLPFRLEDAAVMTGDLLYLAGSVVHHYFRRSGHRGPPPDRSDPAAFIDNLIRRRRKILKKKLKRVSSRKKRKKLSRKLASDVYVIRNLLAKRFKRAGVSPDTADLFRLFKVMDDDNYPQSGKVLKSYGAARERLDRWETDFDKPLRDGSALIEKWAKEPPSSRNASQGGGGRSVFVIAYGIMACFFLTRTSDHSDMARNRRMSHKDLIAYLYETHTACFYLERMLETIAEGNDGNAEGALGRPLFSIEKLKEATEKYRHRTTKDRIRIARGTAIRIRNYLHNIALRENAARFHRGVTFTLAKREAEGMGGGILKIPLTMKNAGSEEVSADIELRLPDKDHHVIWPPGKSEGDRYTIGDHRIAPGTSRLVVRSELAPATGETTGKVRLAVRPRRGTLVVGKTRSDREREPTSSFGNGFENGTEEEDIGPSVRIIERVIDLFAERTSRKEDAIPLKTLAEDPGVGANTEELKRVIGNGALLELVPQKKKGGFLKLRTVTTYNVRLISFKELQEGLVSDKRGAILREGSCNPALAGRVIYGVLRNLLRIPKVERPPYRKRTLVPGDGTAGDRGAFGSGSGPRVEDSGLCREFTETRREIDVCGRRVNSYRALTDAVLEAEAGAADRYVSSLGRDPFRSGSEAGKIFSSAGIAVNTRQRLGGIRPGTDMGRETLSGGQEREDLREDGGRTYRRSVPVKEGAGPKPEGERDARRDLLRQLISTPLSRCIYEHVIKPKSESLRNSPPSQAERILAQLRMLNAEGTVPALTSLLFDVPKDVRTSLFETLGELRDARAIPSLGRMLKNAADKRDRTGALEALLNIGTEEARWWIEEVIGRDEEMRERAEELGYVPEKGEETEELTVLE